PSRSFASEPLDDFTETVQPVPVHADYAGIETTGTFEHDRLGQSFPRPLSVKVNRVHDADHREPVIYLSACCLSGSSGGDPFLSVFAYSPPVVHPTIEIVLQYRKCERLRRV